MSYNNIFASESQELGDDSKIFLSDKGVIVTFGEDHGGRLGWLRGRLLFRGVEAFSL